MVSDARMLEQLAEFVKEHGELPDAVFVSRSIYEKSDKLVEVFFGIPMYTEIPDELIMFQVRRKDSGK
jgi:hypothetical protein